MPAQAIQHRSSTTVVNNNSSSFRDADNSFVVPGEEWETMEEQQTDRRRAQDETEEMTPRKENRSNSGVENGGENSTESTTDGMTLHTSSSTNDVSSQSNDEEVTPSEQNPISKQYGSGEPKSMENNTTDENSNGSNGIGINEGHDDDDDDGNDNSVDDQHYGGNNSSRKIGHSPSDSIAKELKEVSTSNSQDKDSEENNTYELKKGRSRRQHQGRQRLRPSLHANVARKKRGRIVRLVDIDDTQPSVGKAYEQTSSTHTGTERASPSMEHFTEKPTISTLETEASRLTSDNTRTTISFPALPDNQYIAVLRRRAVRKLEDASSATGTGAPSTTADSASKDGKLQHHIDDGQDHQNDGQHHQEGCEVEHRRHEVPDPVRPCK